MFGRRGGGGSPESGGGNTPERALSPQILEAIKHPHVRGWPMEAAALARREGTMKEATVLAKERVNELLGDTINEYHSIKDIATLGEVFGFSARDIQAPDFEESAIKLLERALHRALHVYGTPESVDDFVRFMGGSGFSKKPEVRQVVLAAMKEYAQRMNSDTVPSAFKALIATFNLKEMELDFITPQMAQIIENAPDASRIALEIGQREEKDRDEMYKDGDDSYK